MRGKRTTSHQDQVLTDAENSQTIAALLEIVADLDDRLDRAIDRLDRNEIAADDI